ncbi:hypothetical protein D0T53_11115 [Dysgonomonas sp. 216]|uniref:hypothetical protein n=1 Tax=Dysgonomonas sp. 216 TaxID=2302934 RepID=UPI0013D34E80|nr:hypothetical protein [Dysgonomonas sp. 216]NDW19454.1 hypothetical protein [Dysgonomonas sp. 216]
MKGICFIPPLHRRTSDRVKTQTRRIVEVPQKYKETLPGITALYSDEECKRIGELLFTDGKHLSSDAAKPNYKVGDILFLKEPVSVQRITDNAYHLHYKYSISSKHYKRYVDFTNKSNFITRKTIDSLMLQLQKSKSGWTNKLFLHSSVARLFIRITGVRAEHLQDISEEDCYKEGIERREMDLKDSTKGFRYLNDLSEQLFDTPVEAYADLINRINGKGTWESNPFVWVYDYELTDNPNKVKPCV